MDLNMCKAKYVLGQIPTGYRSLLGQIPTGSNIPVRMLRQYHRVSGTECRYLKRDRTFAIFAIIPVRMLRQYHRVSDTECRYLKRDRTFANIPVRMLRQYHRVSSTECRYRTFKRKERDRKCEMIAILFMSFVST